MHLTVACIQANSTANISENITFFESVVARAAASGAQFITTPENIFLMEDASHPRVFYTQETHPAIHAAQKSAKAHGVWVLVGSVAVQASGDGLQASGKSYNRSLLINPAGEITASYDKIHLFDVDVPNDRNYRESDRFLAGEKGVLADVAGAKLGLTICYDIRFPHLYRTLAKAGAAIITVPAAFTAVTGQAHWHTLLRARAIENGCFIIAPAQTGNHAQGRKTYGHSLIIDPWGNVLADAGEDVGVITATLDLSLVEKTRARLPSLAHDRDFLL